MDAVNKSILIAGGSGLVGTALSYYLHEKGYSVSWLSRKFVKDAPPFVEQFTWDPDKAYLPKKSLEGIYGIVNLCGAGIADSRWTTSRKGQIISSRINPIKTLKSAVLESGRVVPVFISASAVGFYGAGNSAECDESFNPGLDFMGQTCRVWEEEAKTMQDVVASLFIPRIGVVLSESGGMLKKLLPLFSAGLGSAIGNGKQLIPWIHIQDLCSMMEFMLQNPSLSGTYNAVAPEIVSNKEFSRLLAKALSRPYFLPPVPAIILRMIYGEMADVILKGSMVPSKKIIQAGFRFGHPQLGSALESLLQKR